MRRISILGLGLIGSSLALALKKRYGAELEIIGYSRRQETLARAEELDMVDMTTLDLAGAVTARDLVVVATPVLAMRDLLQEMSRHLSSGCVVTDVGSTKATVMRWAEEYLPPTVSFIGGHPMAGKETSGIEEADPDLLSGCVYCLTPSANASEDAIEALEGLVRSIGAKPVVIDAETHDRLVAGVSHLPMLLSAAFVSATTSSPAWPQMGPMAAGGYHDVSRLASGSPEMNRDICVSNREEIIRWIDRYVDELRRFRSLIEEDSEGIGDALTSARDARERWRQAGGQ